MKNILEIQGMPAIKAVKAFIFNGISGIDLLTWLALASIIGFIVYIVIKESRRNK